MTERRYSQLNIFVAWPSDVERERNLVFRVAEELNRDPGIDGLGLRLHPVDWRGVSPGPGRPQGVIMERLSPEESNIFVGILWRRIGDAPGEINHDTGRPFVSGFEEEFTKAYRHWDEDKIRGPQIMLYVSERKARRDQFDPEQQKHLQEFIAECAHNGEHPQLYRSYSSLPQFERTFRQNLKNVIYRYFDSTANQAHLDRYVPPAGTIQQPVALSFQPSLHMSAALQPEPLESFIETVSVPAGEFWMGSERNDPLAFTNETPRRRVYVAQFCIAKYPITNLEYSRFVHATRHRSPDHWRGSTFPAGKEAHPVVNVSYADATAFCLWMTQNTGQLCRLPTEQEWEKAARGGGSETRRYPWGNRWNQGYTNTKSSVYQDTTSVDAFAEWNKSPFGMIDAVGNVWEWTTSEYRGGRYVIRGGSWNYHNRYARVPCRGRSTPDTRDADLGFRVVCIVEEKDDGKTA